MSDPLLDLLQSPPAPPMSVDEDVVLAGGRRRVRRQAWVRASYAAAAALLVATTAILASGGPERPNVAATTSRQAGQNAPVTERFGTGEALRITPVPSGFQVEVDLGAGVWYPFADLPPTADEGILLVDDPGRQGRSGLFAVGLVPASAAGTVSILTNPPLNAVEIRPVLFADRGAYLVAVHIPGALPVSAITGMSWSSDGQGHVTGTRSAVDPGPDAPPLPAPSTGPGVGNVGGEAFAFFPAGASVSWSHWLSRGWSAPRLLSANLSPGGLVTRGDGALFGYRFLLTPTRPASVSVRVIPSAGATGWESQIVAVDQLVAPSQSRYVTVLWFPAFDDGGTYSLAEVTWLDASGTRHTAAFVS